jgi:hypothetical protein
MTIKITKGPAAANVLKILDDKYVHTQLLLDWSFDAIDFKYLDNKWITLTNLNINSLDLDQHIEIKELADYALIHLKDYSEKTNKSLLQLVDLLKHISK